MTPREAATPTRRAEPTSSEKEARLNGDPPGIIAILRVKASAGFTVAVAVAVENGSIVPAVAKAVGELVETALEELVLLAVALDVAVAITVKAALFDGTGVSVIGIAVSLGYNQAEIRTPARL